MAKNFSHSVCPHDCPSCCALEVEILDANTIGRVRGAADHPYTDGVICAKVARYAERVHHPDRLKTPLRRTGPKGSGQFEAISWDEALDTVATAFRDAADRFGAQSVWPYFYSGTMGRVQRDGIKRLRRVMGYSDMERTICSSISNVGWKAGAGDYRGTDSREMLESDLIIMWGTNAASTQVNAMRMAAKARKTRGAKIVCIDPYRTRTADASDLHFALRPGTDGALACAMMHVMFRDGLADRDYLAQYTDVPGKLEKHLQTRTPGWASAITGLDEKEIVDFAHLYGSCGRSFLRLGYGFTRSRNGAANMHAVSCLPALSGAWRNKGGGALYAEYGLYNLDMSAIEGTDISDAGTRILDMSRVGSVLLGDRADIGDGPPVAAMLIQNTNPMVVAPDSSKVRKGFMREDLFVCVHEQFMTETAAMADIVLPATTFLEHDDIYTGGAHSFVQVSRKVIEPCGLSRSNHDVLCALAKRLGAAHPAFEATAWDLIDGALRGGGLPGADDALAARWIDCQKDFDDAHFLNGFAHKDKKFHFAPDWSMFGADHAVMPKLPDHFEVIETADADHPFRLVTAPAHNYLNTTFTETATSAKKEIEPIVYLHPDDCKNLSVAEGDRVRVGNRRGSVIVAAKPFSGLQTGVVIIESIWPNAAFEDGIGVNVLIGADRVPPAGGVAFHDTAVWLRPV